MHGWVGRCKERREGGEKEMKQRNRKTPLLVPRWVLLTRVVAVQRS